MGFSSISDIIKDFYVDRVFPLLGLTKGIIEKMNFDVIDLGSMTNEEKKVDENSYSQFGIKIPIPEDINNGDEKNLFIYITEVFFADIRANYSLLSFNNSNKLPKVLNKEITIDDKTYLNHLYDYAVQKGICKWIASNKASKINLLLETLDDWSKKTYEGHNVCFGFVVDLDVKTISEQSLYSNDLMKFLKDDFAAVLSDGFSTLLKLNSDCELIGFESLTEDNLIKECNLSLLKLPYRFAQIISANATNNKVVIILLQNGDIIVAKDKEIKFIKRNNRWLNFSVNSFERAIKYHLIERGKVDLVRIYSTCIDVSLSHSGGIIAVVKNIESISSIINPIDIIDDEDEKKLFFNEFKNKYTYLLSNEEIELDDIIKRKDKRGLDDYIKKSENRVELAALRADIVNRLTKRKYIIKLLNGKRNINDIDRKLFAELVSLDGACILDPDGNVISFGAIVQNDSGSSGGGRGAAAKKLSNYEGFSIKISTDGYVEIYVRGRKVYSIK